jgi:hypothetical protein
MKDEAEKDLDNLETPVSRPSGRGRSLWPHDIARQNRIDMK